MSIDELKDYLVSNGYEESVVLDEPNYITAVKGVTNNGNVVYDFDLMVKYLMKKDKMTEGEASEFIEYNTIRALPYMGEKAPEILYKIS